MTRRAILMLLAWAGLLMLARPAAAQEASPELRAAAAQVVALLKGERQPVEVFSPAFLRAVPDVQAVIQRLREQHGAPLRVAGIEPRSAIAGTIHVEMARATLHMSLAIAAQPPHLIEGVLVTGADLHGDTAAAVSEALAALPGRTSLAIARLGDGAPELVEGQAPGEALAIASTFKLFILAELNRQVRAGERHWNDIVTLDRRSLPSGMLQSWPIGSPVTLHTLASMMISISDNTATDVLLHLVGRENVERMMATIGVEAAARNRPLLGTLELSVLKTAAEPDQAAWLAANEAERRRLLDTRYAELDPAAIDTSLVTGAPLRIGELGWFASASDLVRTMDWLRRNGDETTLAILAINPAAPRPLRQNFAYVGFKGGSETGVLSGTWLIRNRAGVWHVVTGTWNNPAAPVEEARFFGIMHRALQLVR